MAKFTKAQLIDELSLSSDLQSKAAANRVFSLLKEIITNQVKSGNDVALGSDFGEFKSSIQAAKSGKVPGTDKTYSTAEKRVIKFKSSAPMKKAIAN